MALTRVTTNVISDNAVSTNKLATSSLTRPKVGYSGAVLQIAQWTYNSVYENTASNTEYDLPSPLGDGSANITPTAAANRISIKCIIQCGQEDTWRGNFFRVYYSIAGGGWTALNNAGFSSIVYTSGISGNLGTVGMEYITSYNTLSNIRFKVAQTGHASGGYLHLNQNNSTNSTAANNQFGVSSSIILTEYTA